MKKELEITELLLRLIESDINDKDIVQIERWFRDDPESLKYYWGFIKDYTAVRVQLESEIQSLAENLSLHDSMDREIWTALAEIERTAPTLELKKEKQEKIIIEKAEVKKQPRKISKFFLFSAITSVAALLFMMVYIQTLPPKTLPVAIVTESINAVWGDGDFSGESGARLNNNEGELSLERGLVKILFDYGAEIIVEAPAVFEPESAEQLFLKSGSVTAFVPKEAYGFTVRTPKAKAVDLGTEFALRVYENGSTELHMFKGKAAFVAGFKDTAISSQIIEAGQARRVDNIADGIHDISLDDQSFVRQTEFEIINKANHGSSYHRWFLYSSELRKDTSLVAYYTFDNQNSASDKLINYAEKTSGNLNGILSGDEPGSRPMWVAGRWSNKGALKFDAVQKQYVELPVSKDLQISGDLTIMWWMKVDIMNTATNTIIGYGGALVEGSNNEFNNYYYSFGTRSGRYRAFHEYSTDLDIEVLSDTMIILDQWIQVVISRDSQKKVYNTYLNGSLIKTEQYSDNFSGGGDPKMRCLIGCAGGAYTHKEFYNGLLDELAIFNRVLSDKEIQEMYKDGRAY